MTYIAIQLVLNNAPKSEIITAITQTSDLACIMQLLMIVTDDDVYQQIVDRYLQLQNEPNCCI